MLLLIVTTISSISFALCTMIRFQYTYSMLWDLEFHSKDFSLYELPSLFINLSSSLQFDRSHILFFHFKVLNQCLAFKLYHIDRINTERVCVCVCAGVYRVSTREKQHVQWSFFLFKADRNPKEPLQKKWLSVLLLLLLLTSSSSSSRY